jgi:predicted TIM-barrel fold metal-dependent hydrolase
MNYKTYVLLVIVIVVISCSRPSNNYYGIDDFAKVEKIDAHMHLRSFGHEFVEQAKQDNFQALTILVDSRPLQTQYEHAIYHVDRNPERIKFATTFAMEGWDEPDWLDKTISWIDSQLEAGAVAVKVWKNIGMVYKDRNGNLVMIDDPKFDPLFKYLADKGVPLIGHLGEPKNCWLPLEEMTTNNDRDYFTRHPQYHMYLHPDLPSYEDQIAARDRMLEKNPDLVFIGAHMASLEWDVDVLGKTLDRFPNMAIDIAERTGQLFDQTSLDREKVRNFFIKYQDRIIYATDVIDYGDDNAPNFRERLHNMWLLDWRYFVTDDNLTSHLINREFQGLKLPREVVDKIYVGNARRWLSL